MGIVFEVSPKIQKIQLQQRKEQRAVIFKHALNSHLSALNQMLLAFYSFLQIVKKIRACSNETPNIIKDKISYENNIKTILPQIGSKWPQNSSRDQQSKVMGLYFLRNIKFCYRQKYEQRATKNFIENQILAIKDESGGA